MTPGPQGQISNMLTRTTLEAMFAYAHDAIFIFVLPGEGSPGHFVDVNVAACKLLGYEREELLGLGPTDITPPRLRTRIPRIMDNLKQGRIGFRGALLHRQGHSIPMEFNITVIAEPSSNLVVAFVRDLSREQEAVEALQESIQLYRTLVETAPLLIALFDDQYQLVFVNETGRRLVGAKDVSRLLGRTLWSFIPSQHHEFIRDRLSRLTPERSYNPPVESKLICEDNTVIDVESRNSLIQYGKRPAVLVVAQDVTQRKKAEKMIEEMAYTDQLTKLPNRHAFVERMKTSLNGADEHGTGLTLMFLDLDRFKVINDSFGHDFGDELLRQVAQRLQTVAPENAFVARLGGDEFTLLLDYVDEGTDQLPREIIRVLNESPFQVYGHDIVVSASLGVTRFVGRSETGVDLLRQADMAMYNAKEQGGNTFSWYYSRISKITPQRRVALERGMHQALSRDEFTLVYQPAVAATTGEVIGMEALLRWNSPEFGSVSPAEFIPISEENGLIIGIGEWVLQRVCQQVKVWRDAGMPIIPVAINLSARQFRLPQFTAMVKHLLEDYELPGYCLEFEITERVLMENSQGMIARLQELRELGVQLSIDDFGVGYSSLAYLKQFPIQILKIDQSFIQDLHTQGNSNQIVVAIIRLAHSLGLKVTAEGVETQEQREFLLQHDCDFLQGHLISQPLPSTSLDVFKFNA